VLFNCPTFLILTVGEHSPYGRVKSLHLPLAGRNNPAAKKSQIFFKANSRYFTLLSNVALNQIANRIEHYITPIGRH